MPPAKTTTRSPVVAMKSRSGIGQKRLPELNSPAVVGLPADESIHRSALRCDVDPSAGIFAKGRGGVDGWAEPAVVVRSIQMGGETAQDARAVVRVEVAAAQGGRSARADHIPPDDRAAATVATVAV